MFDLLSFIRQYLNPMLRQPVVIGLCRVLLSPLMSVYLAVVQARSDALATATATGQVAVLEDLLNQATFGTGVGSVYILDGDGTSSDFQVLIPTGLSLDVRNRLDTLIRAHKLAGKRYTMQTQVVYAPDQNVVPVVISWAKGFPYLTAGGDLHLAINERGAVPVKILDGGAVLFDLIRLFNGPTDEFYIRELDVSRTYTIIIQNLTATLKYTAPATQPTGLTAMSYSRDASTHQTTLWFTSDTVYKVGVSLVSGSASGDGWSTDVARPMESITLNGYNKGLRFNPVTNGSGGILSVTYYITVSNQDGTNPVTYAWTPQATSTNGQVVIPLNPTTKPTQASNRAPVVATAIPNQTVTGHGDQTVNVPVNTFADPDGDTLTLSANGLPAGITFDGPGRAFALTEAVANATYNLTVRATDPSGAFVETVMVIVVNRAAIVASAPGAFAVVYADDSNNGTGESIMMQLTPTWRTDANGKNWCTLHDSATPNLPGGYRKYYLIDEDGVPNATMGWNPYEGDLANFGEFPENYMIGLQVITAKGIMFTDNPGSNNYYKFQCGFAQIFTGTKP